MTGGRPSRRQLAPRPGKQATADFDRAWLARQFAGSAAVDVTTVRRQQFPPGIHFRDFPVHIAMMFLVCRLPGGVHGAWPGRAEGLILPNQLVALRTDGDDSAVVVALAARESRPVAAADLPAVIRRSFVAPSPS
jgi:hypothetical protein